MKYLFIFIIAFASNSYANSTLVEQIQKESNLENEEAAQNLNLVFDSIKLLLAQGEKVQIRNFGTFYLKERKARTGINPRTQEKIEIPTRNYPRFRASKNLKELVR